MALRGESGHGTVWRGKRTFDPVDEPTGADLPRVVYGAIRDNYGTVFFADAYAAWTALAAALAELRKAVDVL